MSEGKRDKMPVLFVGHGPVDLDTRANPYSKTWHKLGPQLPRPRGILVISAHWETMGATRITASENPRTLHDHKPTGTPLDEFVYPAPGSRQVAQLISDKIRRTRIELTEDWGLDQGSWLPLRHLFPEADIPVMQLSLEYTRPVWFHYEMGRELGVLRNHGILVIGSGAVVQNLRRSKKEQKPFKWAVNFEEKVRTLLAEGRIEDVIDVRRLPDYNKMAVPTMEHYLPFVYVMGMLEEEDQLKWFNEGFLKGGISMRSLIASRQNFSL